MFGRHRAVMGAEQPPLEQRDDLMDVGQQLRGRFSLTLEKRDATPVPVPPQRLIAKPAVRVHQAAGFDGVLDEAGQARSRRILQAAQADSAQSLTSLHLHRNSYQGFGFPSVGRRAPDARRRCTLHRPRRGPSTGPVPDGPSPAAACAATPTRSCSCAGPVRAAGPRH